VTARAVGSANAGIPVSQRRLARSVRFVTAATAFPEEQPGALDWAALAGVAG
jgi:siroheme synthase